MEMNSTMLMDRDHKMFLPLGEYALKMLIFYIKEASTFCFNKQVKISEPLDLCIIKRDSVFETGMELF